MINQNSECPNAPAKLLRHLEFPQMTAHDFEILEGEYAGKVARYYGIVDTYREFGWWVFFDPEIRNDVMYVHSLWLEKPLPISTEDLDEKFWTATMTDLDDFVSKPFPSRPPA